MATAGRSIVRSRVHIIAYNPELAHLYLPGGESATMATIGISSEGKASVLGMVSTARDSHRVTTDGRDQVYAMKQVTVKITSCWVLMRLQSFEIRNLINAKVPA